MNIKSLFARLLRQSSDNKPDDQGQLALNEFDLSGLAQFQTEARIERLVPIVPEDNVLSWYGGNPRMPDHMDWPSVDGQSLVFVAQLHCADLPTGLWGGIGPRSGWLLIFFGSSYLDEEASAFPVKILLSMEFGEERQSEPESEMEWLSSTQKTWHSVAQKPIPRWPVRIYEKAANAPEHAAPFRQRVHLNSDRPSPHGKPWPGGLAGNPLTRAGLRTMLGTISTHMSEVIVQQSKLLDDFDQKIYDFENPEEDVDADEETLEFKQFQYEVAIRRKPDIEAARRYNEESLTNFNEYRDENPIDEHPEQISDQVWSHILAELNEFRLAHCKHLPVVKHESEIRGEVYNERQFSIERPERISELKKSVTKITSEMGKIQKKLQVAATNRTALIDRHKKLPQHEQETITERQQFQLKRAAETLEHATSLAVRVKKDLRELCEFRDSSLLANTNGIVNDAIWKEVSSKVSKLAVPDFKWGTLLPKIRERSDFEVQKQSIVDAEKLLPLGVWPRESDEQRRVLAFELYSENPTQIPKSVRQHFEPIWSSAAQDQHDGIGGLPRWDGYHATLFYGPSYYSDDDLQTFLNDKPYMAPMNAPFDKDNAVLLQLFSNSVMGWVWGDASHVTLVIPRAELANQNFNNVLAIVEG